MNATLSPAILARFPQQRVLIVGDVMLDEYIWGAVRRISQEAPVPIVEAQRRTYVPGGASNVATNAVSLGGVALLCGLVGTDESAGQLRRALVENGVLAEGLRADATRPTTTKTRILAQSQQVARIDTEQRDPISEALETELLAWTAAQMPTVGVCVLSDYSKGVISSRIAQGVIAQARANNKPVVVDPKGTDFTKYRGATVITPNIPEAEKATNSEIRDEADLWRVSRLLLEILDGSDLLITRGAQGMSLFSGNDQPIHIPTVARNVYDETGAGDTVVSTLALALAAGASLELGAHLATRAAGIVVGKLGTSRVTLEELQQDLAAL